MDAVVVTINNVIFLLLQTLPLFAILKLKIDQLNFNK